MSVVCLETIIRNGLGGGLNRAMLPAPILAIIERDVMFAVCPINPDISSVRGCTLVEFHCARLNVFLFGGESATARLAKRLWKGSFPMP